MPRVPTTWSKSTVTVWPLLAVPRDGAGAGWDLSALSPSVQGGPWLHALRAPLGGLPRSGWFR